MGRHVRGFYKDDRGRTRPITGSWRRLRAKYVDVWPDDGGKQIHSIGGDVPGHSDRYLYHVTDEAGLHAIMSSGEVRPMTLAEVGRVTSFTDNPQGLLKSSFQEYFYDPHPTIEVGSVFEPKKPKPVLKKYIIVFDKRQMSADGVVKPVVYDLGELAGYMGTPVKPSLRMHMPKGFAGESEWRSLKPVKIRRYLVTVLKYDQEAFYHGSD